MDTRTTSADFYPGGKTPVTAGGGITSGETGGAAGEPMVPVTKVEQLPEHYRESDMRSKINELARVISGGVAAIMAMVSLTLGAEPVKVLGAKKDALWNDDFVVTNVVVDSAKFATTNTVTGATNALAATFVRGLKVATNAVLQAGAKEIAAATNALSQSVDERLKASTNGSFSASSLEPYAKRTWVEAQGYLKSTNVTGYAQIDWVQNQGYIKKENASGEIARIVDEKIAAQDETAAYRLMSADGSQWIDGTGVCWRVESNVEVNATRIKGERDDTSWNVEDVHCCCINTDQEGIFIWSYDYTSRRVDEEGTEIETYHRYRAETNISTGTVQLRILEEDNYQTAEGYLPVQTLDMHHWLETNAVTRLATTSDQSVFLRDGGDIQDGMTFRGNDFLFDEGDGALMHLHRLQAREVRLEDGNGMDFEDKPEKWEDTWNLLHGNCDTEWDTIPKLLKSMVWTNGNFAAAVSDVIAADKKLQSYKAFSNAVCNIVTNTAPGGVGIGDNWRITSGAWDGFSLQYVKWVDEPRALYGGVWSVRVVDGSGHSVDDELTADPPTAWRLLPFGGMVVERDSKEVNALGLAMAKDLEGVVTSVSNTVVEIVTNEIMVGWTEWEVRKTAGYAGIVCSGVYATDGPSSDEPVRWMIDCKEWSELYGLQEQKYHVPGTGSETNLTFTSGLTATRRRVTQNALGLAMAKDLEKLPDHETVTNVARSVVNSVWDASLGVAWEARMHNGHLYYIAVTNKPPEVK